MACADLCSKLSRRGSGNASFLVSAFKLRKSTHIRSFLPSSFGTRRMGEAQGEAERNYPSLINKLTHLFTHCTTLYQPKRVRRGSHGHDIIGEINVMFDTSLRRDWVRGRKQGGEAVDDLA